MNRPISAVGPHEVITKIALLLAALLLSCAGAFAQWPNGYNYQGTITVHHAQVPNTTQTNFPVLVSGTFPALASVPNGGGVSNPSGFDIIFTSDSAGLNPLNYERESYSPSGQVSFWVQVPSLSPTSDTVFYVFYGNPSVSSDQSNKTETWDSNYQGVWHLPNGTALSASDSTSNQINGSISGSTAVSGIIDGAANFNGSSSFINFGSHLTPLEVPTALTVSAWVKPNSNAQNSYANIVDYDYSTPREFPYVTYKLSPNDINNGRANQYEFELSTTANGDNAVYSGVAPIAGTWAYLVGTYDGTTQKIYVNGSLTAQAAVSGNLNYSNGNFVFGANGALNQELWNGVTDEVRVSKSARSADWIATEYNNQSSPSTFFSATWGSTPSGASGNSGDPEGSTPTITPSPSGLSFSAPAGGSNPSAQSTSITVSGGASWTATANQSWITLSTSQNGTYGSTATSTGTALWIQVATNGVGLTTGLNSATVTLTSSGATSVPLSISFTISSVSSSTWANGYNYQGTITVHHAQVPNTTQTNFPVLVSGTFPALASVPNGGGVSNPSGFDIIFTSDSAGLNPLNYERESYSPSGQVSFWVQVPSLSPTSDTVFYVFYGNPSVSSDQSNKTETWDSNYQGVWHLPNGTALSASDSTSNQINGSISGSTAVSGIIDGAANFNGSSSFINFGSHLTPLEVPTALTVSAWVKPNSNAQNSYANIVDYDYSTPREFPYVTYKLSPNDINNGRANQYEFELSTTANGDNAVYSGVAPIAGTWAYLVGTYDGTTQKIYVNGSLTAQAAVSGNLNYSNGNFVFGANGALNQELWNGVTDEVRVSKSARSADWIATEYNNQSSPSTFFSATWGSTPSGASGNSGDPEGSTPTITPSPSGLSFSAPAGGSNPSAQSTSITVSGGASWTATANQSWITLSTSQNGTYGSTATSTGTALWIQVATNGAGLSTGLNSATVTISSSGAVSQFVNISFTIAAAAPPPSGQSAQLSVAPANLFFSAVAGSPNPTAQSLAISSPNGGFLGSWTATASQPWIALPSTSGTGAQIVVGASIGGLASGPYSGTVTISSPGATPSSQTVNVTLVIEATPAAYVGASGTQPPLYNGIVLPQQWPPLGGATQSYQPAPYIDNPPSVISINVGRQLFVDDFLIAQTTMARTQHQPIMYPGNPILTPSSSPDLADTQDLTFPYSDGVWFDPSDQLFRMWFYCGYGNQVCYAYSTNGTNWVRPQVNGAPPNLIDQVNTIGGGRDSDVVWMDLQDPNPAQRYKMFAYYPPENMLTWFSPDGLTWTSQPQFNILSLQDRTTLFWNPFRNVWVDSMRQQFTVSASTYRPSVSSDRIRYYAESPNLSTWNPSDFTDSFWTMADENDPPYVSGGAYPQLYNLDAVAYESVIVGLFSWFNPGPTDGSPAGAPGPDIVELGVGFSRDGFYWVRPTRGGGPNTAFIPASNVPGTWNMGNTQSAGGGFLVIGDQLWFYFSGRNGTHSTATAGSTGLATLRRDGFYSMDAGATPATLTTRPVTFSGQYMFVNVKDPQGSLQIQVLDPNNNNAVVATSGPLSVDSTLQPVSWLSGSLSQWAGKSVVFQFTLTNGELYSFWVSQTTSGASNGYVGAGGPGFTSNVDTIGSASISAVSTASNTLSVSASSVSLSAQAGSSTASAQPVTITDLGGTLSWTATASAPWITLSSSGGTGVQNISVGAALNGMGVGSYSGAITITAPDANPSTQTINVSLSVTP